MPPTVGTTGHEWDGIEELNTPLPRWWLWLFYATIVWAIGYWIVYPAWPLVSSYTNGVFDWHTRSAVAAELAELQQQRGPMMTKLASASLQEIESKPELLDFARALGRRAFADNCAPCHGAGGGGAKGYPNLDRQRMAVGRHARRYLADDHARRALRRRCRPSGLDAGFRPRRHAQAGSRFRRSPTMCARCPGLSTAPGADLTHGAKIFADNCAVCHGPEGKGNRELGAPNLTDNIWLYAPDKKTIMEGIFNGRGGIMPAWGGKLDDVTIKALAVYVHTFGGGEQ